MFPSVWHMNQITYIHAPLFGQVYMDEKPEYRSVHIKNLKQTYNN